MTGATRRRRRPDRSHIGLVQTREELIYLLSRAAELEHSLACLYLYAAHSLKSDPAEGGLTGEQAATVRGWKRSLAGVAIEEMLHLAQVANLLTAIGGAPHLRRANFPVAADAFAFGIRMTLEPFSHETIDRFLCYEMPEAGILPDEVFGLYDEIRSVVAPLPGPVTRPVRVTCEPYDVDFRTIGEFYHKIWTGFGTLSEHELFIGPHEAQANARFLDFEGQLIAVVDGASAQAAIEMIVTQGEAPPADHPDAHFWVFDRIRKEFAELEARARQTGTPFSPVRPVVSNPTTQFFAGPPGTTPIVEAATLAAGDLFNVTYDTLLLMLLRFFAHTEESEAELQLLARTALRLMAGVLRPLGEALTKMPVGGRSAPAGATAGPGFGYNRDADLLPHKASAWTFFAERLETLVRSATVLRKRPGLPPEVDEAATALGEIAGALHARP